MKQRQADGFGALVISLDFELRWGVRDLYPADGGAYRANLLGARTAIPRLLDLFQEYGVAATWATVGFLFAATRDELARHRPATLPNYADPTLSPYGESPGPDEDADPLHYAASLVETIRARPRQEIASHTFSHYYCLEPGHDAASLRADVESAVAIAKARGVELRSLVFPRNQFNPDYADLLAAAGFTCCRTNAAGWIYRESAGNRYRRVDARAGRLLDTYVEVSGDQVTPWDEIPFVGSLCCLPASHFLRPYTPRLHRLEPLRLRRITASLRKAATEHGVFHLWWHPHNAGVFTDEYLVFLHGILEEYRHCRDRYGMQSLSMADAAAVACSLQHRLAA
ncbi:MAG TPA: polysaccharide deacetylase family protein [Thermomicrobiales bacterium]